MTIESIKTDALNVLRGFCMGAADIVPGVSGGTVALILGHYQRLINAISRVDRVFVSFVLRRRIREAFDHVDGRFLVALGGGIAVGIVSLAGLMHWLLEHRLPYTLAGFLGLILASVWVVRREICRWTAACFVGWFAGILIAAGITMLSTADDALTLPFLFVSGSIAICAMILPGISGAFILLLLGVYYPVTEMIKNAAKLDFTTASLLQLTVFAGGCLFGLLAFSRVLRFLLASYRDTTMAVLVGLMIGSIGRLWPFQVPTPETTALDFKHREFDYVSPADFGSAAFGIALCALGGAAIVLIADAVATRRMTSPPKHD